MMPSSLSQVGLQFRYAEVIPDRAKNWCSPSHRVAKLESKEDSDGLQNCAEGNGRARMSHYKTGP